MPIKIGTDNFTGGKVADKEITKIYEGTTLVWERLLVTTGTISVSFNADNTVATLTAVPTGTSTYTYEWNNATDRSTIISTASFIDVTVDGTYEVRITDTATTIASDYICAVVDVNEGPSAVLVVNDATITTAQTIAGNITVADANHPTTVTWNLTYNGSTVTSGTGDVTNQAFSGVSSGAVGTRNMVLGAQDPDGASASDSISITVSQAAVARSYSRPAGFTGTAGGTLSIGGSQHAGYTWTLTPQTTGAIPTDAFSSYDIRFLLFDIFGDTNGDGTGAFMVNNFPGGSANISITGSTVGTTFSNSGSNSIVSVSGISSPATMSGSVTVNALPTANDTPNLSILAQLRGVVANGFTVNGTGAGGTETLVQWLSFPVPLN